MRSVHRKPGPQPGSWDSGFSVRSYLVFSAFLLGAAALAAHLFFFQRPGPVRDYYLARLSRSWHSFERPQGKRGNILYRDGTLLAGNRKVAQVVAELSLLEDPAAAAASLSGLLGQPVEEVLKRINGETRPKYVLADNVDVDQARKIQRLGLRGIFTRYYYQRYYPHGASGAAATVGFAGREPLQRSGLECAFNAQLSGTTGYQECHRDGLRNALPGSEGDSYASTPGEDLVTTLDPAIQLICNDELKRASAENRSDWGCILVLTPQGEVLAASTSPAFDPNQYSEGEIGSQVNVISQYVIEPGSTIKPLLAAYAVDHGWLDPARRWVCNRNVVVDGYSIHEAEQDEYIGGNDGVPIAEVIYKSSNKGMAQIALKLDQDHVLEAYRRFGFFASTGSGLPGEAAGFPPFYYEQKKHKKHLKWPRIVLANSGFGQGLSVTPLQLAAAYCVIANGGHPVTPRLVLVEDQPVPEIAPEGEPVVPPGEILLTAYGGIPVADFEPVDQVLSPEGCRVATEWLSAVVEKGTGTKAKLERYRAAGKTGTAEVHSDRGGYKRGAYTAIFCGFFPVENPRYVILVLFREPRGRYYASEVAAPVFKRVGDRISYLEGAPAVEVLHAR